jgi:hypothetical protein
MEITNSEILTKINVLKNEIDEQTQLCKSIVKLDKIDSLSVIELVSSTEEKINSLKSYQHILMLRNAEADLEYDGRIVKAQLLIKIKEGILLKKKIKTILISTTSNEKELLNVSLEAFQSVQEYKKELTIIHDVLEQFNNKQFNLEDYK